MGYENDGVMNVDAFPMITDVHFPASLEDALSLKASLGKDANYIAGGTLIQLQREQGIPLPSHLISLEKMKELNGITNNQDDSLLTIGSLTNVMELRTHPLLKTKWQLLAHAAKEIASPAVRNRATIGGNIAYGIGDLIPALLAMDADIQLFDDNGSRNEKIWDYVKKQMRLKPGLIVSVHLPAPSLAGRTKQFYRKIGRREAFIPSIVTVSGHCLIDNDGRLAEIRLAAGGGATLPQRLTECEKLLSGKKLKESLLAEVYELIVQEYEVIPDAFASEDYRKMAAANVILSALEAIMNEGRD